MSPQIGWYEANGIPRGWSKERPTTPGWYWFIPNEPLWPDHPFICRVTEGGSLMYGGTRFEHHDGSLYAGPLHPPELPEEKP